MKRNKLIICTNAKGSQIESNETHYKLKGIPITANASVMNGVYYSKEENGKGMPTMVGKPFTIDHPADENGNFISAMEGNGLMDYFSGGVVTNVYEVNDVWYADAEIKKSLLAAQTNGDKLQSKLDNKEDLGVSTGLYFSQNTISGANAAGVKYTRSAINQQFNHLAAVDDPAGGKETTAVFNSENTFVCNFEMPEVEKECKDKRSAITKAWNAAKKLAGINALSHDDIRRQLNDEINNDQQRDRYKWVVEVYDSYFIYIDDSDDGNYYQMSYEIDSDDSVMLSGEPQKVVKKFVKANAFAPTQDKGYNSQEFDVNQPNEGSIMNRDEMLEALGLATNSQVTDDELKTLMKSKLAANASEGFTKEDVESIVNAAIKPLADQLTANANKELDQVAEQVAALNKGLDADDAKALGIDKAKAFLAANGAEYVADGYGGPQSRTTQTNSDDGEYRSQKPGIEE